MKIKFSIIVLMISFAVHSNAQSRPFSYSRGSAWGDDVSSYSGGDSVFVGTSIFYKGDNINLSSSRDRSHFLGRILLGYRYRDWNFGVEYDSDNEKNTFEDASGESEYSWIRSAFGPVVGYNLNNFYANLTIFVSPTLKTKAPGIADTAYSGNMGYQLAVGYNYELTNYMTIGLQIAYRAFEYKKSKSGGTETTLTEKYNTSSIDPFLNLTFFFR